MNNNRSKKALGAAITLILLSGLLIITPGAGAFSGSGGIGPGKLSTAPNKARPSGGINISELSPASVKRFLRRSWRREINAAGRVLRSSAERFSGALQASPATQAEISATGRCLRAATQARPAVINTSDYQRFIFLGLLNSGLIANQQFNTLNHAEQRRFSTQRRQANQRVIKKLFASNARFLTAGNSLPTADYCQLVQEWVDNDYRQAAVIINAAFPQQQFSKYFRRWTQTENQRQRSYLWGQKYSRRASALLIDPRQAVWNRFLNSVTNR